MDNALRALKTGERQAFTVRRFEFPYVERLSRLALDLHLQLYAGYVGQLNALQSQVLDLAGKPSLSAAEQVQKDGLVRRLAFEFNGMVLHEKFFEQLNSRRKVPSPMPGSTLVQAIESSFAGFEGWWNDITQLAETRGVGWVVCARHENSNQLSNFWVSEHQLGVPAGMRLIAVFDLWEHAYLLDFSPTARRDYLDVLFDNIDWSVIEARCA